MSNPARRKGSEWEARIASHLTDRGTFVGEVFRAPQWGPADKGDLVNTGDFVFEAKATKKQDLATFLAETEEERKNAGRRWGVCVIKRRNHKLQRAYAVMELEQLLDLIEALPLEVRLGLNAKENT